MQPSSSKDGRRFPAGPGHRVSGFPTPPGGVPAAAFRSVCTGVLSCTLVAACGAGDGGSAAAEVAAVERRPVVIETVTVADLTPSYQTSGIVEAQARMELSLRVGGYVERLHVDEGDRIEVGQVLLELDRRDLQREMDLAHARLARTKATLTEAKLDFQRQAQLRATDQTSDQTYRRAESTLDVTRADLKEAEVRLAVAEDQLADAVLAAPVTGYVEARYVEAHEYAEARVPVFAVIDVSTVKIRATLPDREAPFLEARREALVWSAAAPDERFTGTVTMIGVAADRETRAIPFEVTVIEPGLALRPDAVAQVRLTSSESRRGVLVPIGAVLRDVGEVPFCFVMTDADDGPTASRRPITLGALLGERVGVTDGLNPGDRLIVSGQHFVADGDPVEAL